MSEFLSPDPKLLIITISNISFQSLLLHFSSCMAFILQTLAGQHYSPEKINEGQIPVSGKMGPCVTLRGYTSNCQHPYL